MSLVALLDRSKRRLVMREKLHLVDYSILALAATSLVVFALAITGELAGFESTALHVVDLILVALYGTAFGFKWMLADKPASWFKRNAIHALGVFPLTIPILVPDRFFVVMQVAVIALRFGEALDRAFGAQVVRGLLDRYKAMLVEELADPLLLRLVGALEQAVVSRDYAAAIGRRLDQRRDLVEAAVTRAIAASPKLSRLDKFGPFHSWMQDSTREMVDAAHAALTGPEVNDLIREGLQDTFAELKTSIRERKWQGRGLGVTDVAKGVIGGQGPDAPNAP